MTGYVIFYISFLWQIFSVLLADPFNIIFTQTHCVALCIYNFQVWYVTSGND